MPGSRPHGRADSADLSGVTEAGIRYYAQFSVPWTIPIRMPASSTSMRVQPPKRETHLSGELMSDILKINSRSSEDKKEEQLARRKDILSIIQSISTVLAIIGTLIWFIWTRETAPRLSTEHSVTYLKISDKYAWIRLQLKIKNEGKVPVRVGIINADIDQILPLAPIVTSVLENGPDIVSKVEGIVPWPYLAEANVMSDLYLEYGEFDYQYFDFIIPVSVSTYEIYSRVRYEYFSYVSLKEKESDTGWSYLSVHNADKG